MLSLRSVLLGSTLAAATVLLAAQAPTSSTPVASDCKALLNAVASGPTRVLSAELVTPAPGAPWRPPGQAGRSGEVSVEFCRIEASVRPTPKSDIRFEVWLPTHWNGNVFGTSSGGLAGIIDYAAMTGPVSRGFVAMGHNNGHFGGATDLTWAFDQDGKIDTDRVVNFAWRSLHLATIAAKELARSYYKKPAVHAYYVGCSQGGHHGQMEALRFPQDYDAIAAGGGGSDWTGLLSSEAWAGYSVVRDNHAGGIPKAMLPVLARYVIASCDGLDGVVDGLIEDPRRCKVDFTPLRCRSGQTVDCLTPAQIAATEAIYAGPPGGVGGHMPGSEAGWVNTWNAETEPGTRGAYFDWFRLLVRQQPDFKIQDFNWPGDVNLSRQRWDSTFAAFDPDISQFKSRGGKLILYHGWADPLMPPGRDLSYWRALEAKMGSASVASFARLFMVAGGGHCGGGPLDQAKVDWLGALQNWLEKGIPPDPDGPKPLLASGILADGTERRRILCPYPETAHYRGSGDINTPENFTCVRS